MLLGTPLSPSATRVMLLGAGELGKEVVIALQRLGVEVVAVDRYANAPGHQVAHRAHVIDMADAAVTLTRVPGTPTGTLMTGNVLYVDPNVAAGAGAEVMKLPPEADCAGMWIWVINTSGDDTITLQNDAGGAIESIANAESAICACDGTTWYGFLIT